VLEGLVMGGRKDAEANTVLPKPAQVVFVESPKSGFNCGVSRTPGRR